MNNVDAKLLNEQNEGLALDLYNARLAGNPIFAAAEKARVAAEQAASIAQLDAIQLTIPARRTRKGRP